MADYTPIQEGDALSAKTLDEKFSSLEDAVNKVDTVALRALDHYNSPPSLVEPNVAFQNGARFMGHAGHPTDTGEVGFGQPYIHKYSLGDSKDPIYPGFNTSTTATDSPGSQEPGWRVIGDSLPIHGDVDNVQGRTDGKLECSFGADQNGLLLRESGGNNVEFKGIGGILVMFNAEVLFFHNGRTQPQPVGTYDTVGIPIAGIALSIKLRAYFGIQVYLRQSDGTAIGWFNIRKATRAISMPSTAHSNDGTVGNSQSATYPNPLGRGLATSFQRGVRGSMWKDVSIRTLITADDLDTSGLADLGDPIYAYGSNIRIGGVRAVVSLEDVGPHSEDGQGVTLKAYSMSTLILASELGE